MGITSKGRKLQESHHGPGLPKWRQILYVEARGIRTALAVVLPFVLGQVFGHVEIGLMVGLGGLYLCITDKNDAGWRMLLMATLGIAVSAFLGTLVGPYALLATVAMFIWTFANAMTATWGEAVGNTGFAITIVFAVTLGLSPLKQTNNEWARMAEFAVGGLWATGATLLLWRVIHQPATPIDAERLDIPRRLRELRGNLTLRSPVFQHALRIAVAAALAVALYKGRHLEHGYWLILTVLVIVKKDWEATRRRAGERILGSLVGGVLGIVLALTVRNLVTIDLLLLVLCMIAFSHTPTNYGLYVTFLTPFVVLMINIAAPGNWQIALVRIEDTFLGGALALAVAYLMRFNEVRSEAVWGDSPIESPER